MKHLANILTSLSLLCGFASILFSLEGHFTFAAWAILVSVVLDGLDGQVARMAASSSEFGKELDSLVDVVAFGIAPSILGYIFICQTFHAWATLALFIYLLASVIRLAKYNITAPDKIRTFFYGLPTTVSGGVIASAILLYRKYARIPPSLIFFVLVLILAVLMVSKIHYLNLDGLRRAIGKRMVLLLLIAAPCLAFFTEITLFGAFLIYLLFSPFVVKSLGNLKES
jgi:CDP-diacylglycerol---serine O-phosphatidyltransferase